MLTQAAGRPGSLRLVRSSSLRLPGPGPGPAHGLRHLNQSQLEITVPVTVAGRGPAAGGGLPVPKAYRKCCVKFRTTTGRPESNATFSGNSQNGRYPKNEHQITGFCVLSTRFNSVKKKYVVLCLQDHESPEIKAVNHFEQLLSC
jgi:hypothetical protein